MSKIKFVLTLIIEGESLEDIDNGLVQAAGQRLIARMSNSPTLNSQTIIKGPDLKEVKKEE